MLTLTTFYLSFLSAHSAGSVMDEMLGHMKMQSAKAAATLSRRCGAFFPTVALAGGVDPFAISPVPVKSPANSGKNRGHRRTFRASLEPLGTTWNHLEPLKNVISLFI